MCRSFFGYEIFIPDLICFYTIAYKTCFAFILSQIKKAALRAAEKLKPNRKYDRKGLATQKGIATEKGYDRKGVATEKGIATEKGCDRKRGCDRKMVTADAP